MNEQNLIPNSRRSREELQEMGRKGGIKSGEVRRHNRELRKLAAGCCGMLCRTRRAASAERR